MPSTDANRCTNEHVYGTAIFLLYSHVLMGGKNCHEVIHITRYGHGNASVAGLLNILGRCSASSHLRRSSLAATSHEVVAAACRGCKLELFDITKRMDFAAGSISFESQ